VIVTATRSAVPLFDGTLVAPGCTIIAVGSARANAAEIDAVTVSGCARIVVEATDIARHEAGDLLLAGAAGVDAWPKVGELGNLLADRIGGRESDDEINLFESLGFALEDVAIAAIAYQRLREQGRT
jgi:ornithine cyclodeaminase